MPAFCLGEFLRVVTHARLFEPPSSLDVALEFVERLLASPTARLLTPGRRYWRCLHGACNAGRATGNLVFDAQIAAVCSEWGATRLVTDDRDFARFPNLDPEGLV